MMSALPELSSGKTEALYILAFISAVILTAIIVLSVKKRIRFLPALLAVSTVFLICVLCIFYPDVRYIYAHPDGDPKALTDSFMGALASGRISEAYDVLYTGTSGGVISGSGGAYVSADIPEGGSAYVAGSTLPDDDISAAYYDVLKNGFTYEYTGEMSVDGLSASIPVRITYSDLDAVVRMSEENLGRELDMIVQSHARRDVYGEDDSYENWVIEEAYTAASEKAVYALSSPVPSRISRDLNLELNYRDGGWHIEPSEDLLNVLGAGVCGNPASEKILYDRVVQYVNNAKADILSDLVYIPKQYSIPEDAVCGYVPCDDKFHELTDPALITEAIADSDHLIRGADLVFDTNVTFAPGQKIYYYADDSLFAIVWKEFCNNCYCNFAEVFISDPSQLRRKIAGDTYGYSAQLYASTMAAQANSVVAINGDFYKFRSPGLCVYDRVVYRCESSYLDTCFFDTKGNMIFSYAGELKDKEEAQRFVDDNDILFSVSFGPVLIDNGVPKENLNYRIGETMQRYSRASIGQIGEGHYLLMTIGHVYPYRECCTLKGAQDIMLLKGCVNAYTLDGGQTAEIVWRDRPYSYVDWGVERTISDIIYFATAVPEDEQ